MERGVEQDYAETQTILLHPTDPETQQPLFLDAQIWNLQQTPELPK